MKQFIDFDEVRTQYPILEVVNRLLGAQLIQESAIRHRGPCPYCEDKRSFTVTINAGHHGQGMAGCFEMRLKRRCNRLYFQEVWPSSQRSGSVYLSTWVGIVFQHPGILFQRHGIVFHPQPKLPIRHHRPLRRPSRTTSLKRSPPGFYTSTQRFRLLACPRSGPNSSESAMTSVACSVAVSCSRCTRTANWQDSWALRRIWSQF